MASESDSDLIISKRPKKRLTIRQDMDPSGAKSGDEEDIVMINKRDKAMSDENILVEHKKAVKRTRESEEESSITSDDEVNIKKKIRKNSDLYRQKKTVSVAARKRREAAKTLRESKIAASETDSEYDTDENLKSEDNTSQRKQFNSVTENKILIDSKDCLKAENIFPEKDIQEIQKSSDKAYQKNEDSSSAYNSDSQDGVHLQHIAKKEGKKIELSEEKNISLSPNILSYNKKKVDKSLNSESELDEDDDTLVLKNKLDQETHRNDEKQTNFSQDSQKSNNIHSDIIEEKHNEVSKNFKSEHDIALHFVSNSEKTSSDDETVGKMKTTSEVGGAEIKEKNVKRSLKEQNTLKSGSDNSSEDDQPLKKSKEMAVKEENLKQNRITSQNSDTSEDEKDQKMYETNSSKMPSKIQNSSTDSSDSDRLNKKTNTTRHLKQKKKKVVKQSSKKQYSSEERSSDEEQPLKKTKSSSSKSQRISDSGESDNFTLKTRVKTSKRKVQKSSSDEEKLLKTPLNHSKTGNNKSNIQRLGEELGIGKKEQNSSQKNPSKGKKVEKKPVKAYIPDGLSSSDDDRPLKNNKSSGQTKIAKKEKVLKSIANQNNSEDEQPLKKTKSSGTKTNVASDSEDNVYQTKYNEVQNSKNRHKQSTSNSDDDKPLERKKSVLNKKSNETNQKHKKKRIEQLNSPKKVSSDSEEDPIKFQKEIKITEKIETHASSEVSTNDSSSNSDVPLSKKTDARVKVTSEKTTVKRIPDKTCKHSAKSEDTNSSDSDNGNFEKKQIKECTEDSSAQAKKEISDSETSEEERNSKGQQRKPSMQIKDISDTDKQNSDSSNKSLKDRNKTEISDSAESSDSSDDKKGKREKKSDSSKKSYGIVKKQSISTSCESESDSSRKDKTTNKKKTPSKMVARINNLKKYIRAAGIHINNYASFWEGCKSDKQRADKLSTFLADHGMKGRPTLQKCKKLRVKLEKKREVEELDLSNIIDNDENGGRYKCRSSRRQPTENKNIEIGREALKRAAELKQRFSRIKDLIESDSSSD